MRTFAIVLVCYNRVNGLKRLTDSLLRADYGKRTDIDLIFSIDNSGTDIVEKFAQNFEWSYGKKQIRTFEIRQGLKNHILQCGDFTEQYDIICVLEDDLYVSDSFYHYAYQSADYYWDDDKIAGISLYNFQKNWLNWHFRFEPMRTGYDAYFLKVAMSWGQVWTSLKWKVFKTWYNEHLVFTKVDTIPQYLNEWPESSWLKYHTRFCIETDRYFVYPYSSLSTNFSDAGTHSNRTTNDHQVELMFDKRKYIFDNFSLNSVVYDEYMNRVGLGRFMGIPENELTVDLFNTKCHNYYKRYLLSTSKHPYFIKNKYALSLRPIEGSILLGLKGEGIYLYDIKIPSRNRYVFNPKYELELYNLRSRDFRIYLPLSLKMTILESARIIVNRIKKILHVR